MIPKKLEQLVEPALADLGFECVRIRYMSGAGKSARGQLQIMVEPIDLREMTVEDCAKISRHLSAILDVEDPISDAYQLEISSPGVDRPLTRLKDFSRFSGELIKITLKQMLEGQKRYRGRLAGVDDEGVIHVETLTGRVSATLDQIDTAKIDPTEFFSTQKQPAKNIKQARTNKEEA